MARKLASTLTTGALAAVPAALIGLFFDRTSTTGRFVFPVAAAAGAMLTAAFFWWLLVARREKYTVARGALAGALTGAVSHWVCVYLFIVGQHACTRLRLPCADPAGPVAGLLDGLGAAGKISFFSLIFLGWLTVPVGALVGAAVGRVHRAPP